MKKELNPLVLIGIAALAVIVLVMFGYRALQPAHYEPSPGASPADDPWLKTHPAQPTQTIIATTPDGKPYYPVAAPGSIPGRPGNSTH
ncbi:MAG: hypothetical protein JWL77_1363 [Chthonomonadaceae bacterium]|nr:hypothetical protein [Chthonomonadaceae bacterium]